MEYIIENIWFVIIAKESFYFIYKRLSYVNISWTFFINILLYVYQMIHFSYLNLIILLIFNMNFIKTKCKIINFKINISFLKFF